MRARLVHLAAASALVFAMIGGRARSAHADTAYGYTRPVDIAILSFFLYHTYEYESSYGYAAFGGSTSGGYIDESSSYTYGGEWNCMANQGRGMSYAWNGVCHNGTNNALWETPINYVYYWPGVDGSGASYSAFGNFGAGCPYLCSDWGPPSC